MIHKISTGKSRTTKVWTVEEMSWLDLRNRFATPTVTRETAAEYAAMSKEERGDIKDVGGLVGGPLKNGVRKKGMIEYRSLITIDYDAFSRKQLDALKKILEGCRWVIHSTHSHTNEDWRVRIVLPLDRKTAPEEAEAAARRIAWEIGTDGIDRSTFEAERLMYWPSRSVDGPYLFEEGDINGRDVSPDEWLACYDDWTDMAEWPKMPGDPDPDKLEAKKGESDYEAFVRQMNGGRGMKVEDPMQKEGIIGAWCRSHPMRDLLDCELADVYKRAGKNRYTYMFGKASKGAILFDDRWLFSFHSTDPAGGHSQNAWDLYRIHRFGHLDVAARRGGKLPSVKAMEEFAAKDPATLSLMRKEAHEKAQRAFEGIEIVEGDSADPDAWLSLLERKKGKVENTLPNYEIIIANDPELKDKIQYNIFSGLMEIKGRLPWTSHTKFFNDREMANMQSYIARNYDGICHTGHLNTGLISALNEKAYHPVKIYFNSLKWDGKQRLERLIIDVLGAEDTEINRILTKMTFVAAVTRIFNPGTKFDTCLILYGPEGCGKSTLFSLMGGEWFTDSIRDFDSKDAFQTIQGNMIIELGELSVFDRSSTERIKQVLSSDTDKFRPAYARCDEVRPRECIFVGTTNQEKCLRGFTGNRRFPIITVNPSLRKPELPWVRGYVEENRDQLWAEAVELFRQGFPLHLSPEMDLAVREQSERHNFDLDNPDYELVDEFLNRDLPEGWEQYSMTDRREWLNGSKAFAAIGKEPRTRVCMKEILSECFGLSPKDAAYRNKSRDLARYMDSRKDWEKRDSIRFNGYLGRQRGWVRKGAEPESSETEENPLDSL